MPKLIFRKHLLRHRFSVAALAVFLTSFAVLGAYMVWAGRAYNPNLTGDVNDDGTVNVYDLSDLLSVWHTNNYSADLNKDGTVDVIDLSLVLSHWGQTGPSGQSFFSSIDTMKDSRDTDYPTNNQMASDQIQQEITLTAQQHVNYITDDAFYDYPNYMQLWADNIHAAGKHVWFRPHFNCWELDNGCTTQMTPSAYVAALSSFLTTHYSMFKPGDIFDPNSEPEDSTYWQKTYGTNYSWQNAPNAGTDEYNSFMLNVSQTAQNTLQQHGVNGVITNIRSTSGWWPQNHEALYASTIKALGCITYDSYPDSVSSDPAIATKLRTSELDAIIQDNPGVPIVLGELGYNNDVNVSDATQLAVLNAEMNALATYKQIVGLNYWVGAGGAGYGGYTNIFSGTRGNWQPRPAAAAVAQYFMSK